MENENRLEEKTEMELESNTYVSDDKSGFYYENKNPQPKTSNLKIFYDNLIYHLSYFPALLFLIIGFFVSLFLTIVLISRNNGIGVNGNISLWIIVIVFTFTVLMFYILIHSIILNIIRRQDGKR